MQSINTALLSFGMSGQVFHAPFLSVHSGFNLYGVWERTKNLAQEKYPSIKTFRSLDELLKDPSIELIVVNTPSVTHYEYAKACLDAGKNVIVEKPFTSTVQEGEELIKLAKRKNKLLSDPFRDERVLSKSRWPCILPFSPIRAKYRRAALWTTRILTHS